MGVLLAQADLGVLVVGISVELSEILFDEGFQFRLFDPPVSLERVLVNIDGPRGTARVGAFIAQAVELGYVLGHQHGASQILRWGCRLGVVVCHANSF